MRDRNPIMKAAADMKDCPVSRYHATRTAASGHEGGDSKEMLQKGIDTIEHGLHLLKSSLLVRVLLPSRLLYMHDAFL